MAFEIESLLLAGRTGDLILSSGKGRFTDLIKWATRSRYAHAAWLLAASAQDSFLLFITESTMSSASPDLASIHAGRPEIIKGVQLHIAEKWIEAYQGEIWWCPLKQKLSDAEEKALIEWAAESRNKRVPYDLAQALGAGMDFWDELGFENEPDYRALFCSEYYLRGLQKIGRIDADFNCSEATPADILPLGLHVNPIRVK